MRNYQFRIDTQSLYDVTVDPTKKIVAVYCSEWMAFCYIDRNAHVSKDGMYSCIDLLGVERSCHISVVYMEDLDWNKMREVWATEKKEEEDFQKRKEERRKRYREAPWYMKLFMQDPDSFAYGSTYY